MGKSTPAQGAELTGNVFSIDISQGLQADNAGNADAKDYLAGPTLNCILDTCGVHSLH